MVRTSGDGAAQTLLELVTGGEMVLGRTDDALG
jgi:hypothetical protein